MTSTLKVDQIDGYSNSDVVTIPYLHSGTGAVARTIRGKQEDVVSVKDFGAAGDGTTDDTTAINAAIVYAATQSRRALLFPHGNYKITASLTSISSSTWRVYGEGKHATRIFTTFNGPVFTIDTSTTGVNFVEFSDMAIEGEISGTYSSSVGILVAASAVSQTGLNRSQFRNIRFRDLYRGIYLEQTGLITYLGTAQLSNHGLLFFQNIDNVVETTNQTYECIASEGASPQITTYMGGFMQSCSNACIRLGSGAANDAVGDQLFSGIHMFDSPVGIDLVGPTGGATRYNQNVTITGCQSDGMSVATFRLSNMQNFRIGPNNATSTVGMSLTSCENYTIDDRNEWTFNNVNILGNLVEPAPTVPLVNYGGHGFDGTTDYLDSNALTGIADGKKGTIVMLVRFGLASGVAEFLMHSTSGIFTFQRASTGAIQVIAKNSAASTILNVFDTANTALDAAGTYAIMISWDLATAGSLKCYVNDEEQTMTETTFTNDTIDYTVGEYGLFGAVSGASYFNGDAYVVWFDPTQNLDFSDAAVRRKFFDTNKRPVFMGRQGELVTGTAPGLFLAYDDYASWARNRGTFTGTFTDNGTPSAATTAISGQFFPVESIGVPVTVTADYTVGRTDTTVINNRAATNTLTLPSAAANRGRLLNILTIQAQTVVSVASDVIPITGGAAGTAILAAADGAWATLQSDGTSWQIIAS